MFNRYIPTFAGLTLLMSAQCAIAGYVYDESIDGDLDTAQIPTFDFTAGTNTILGTASFDILTTPFSSDFDYFDFTIPANTIISEVIYSFDVLSNDGNPVFFTVIHLKEKNGIFNSVNPTPVYISAGSGSKNVSIWHLPTVDLYQWKQEYRSYNSHQERVSWNYEISFSITPVPLPASALLFLSGMVAMLTISSAPGRHNSTSTPAS